MDEIDHGYHYTDGAKTWSNGYLWPPLRRQILGQLKPGARILDLGCGSGATTKMLADLGFELIGVDPSESGISAARKDYPALLFEVRSAYDDLVAEFGQFDAVVSLEVVEHCFWPRRFMKTVVNALRPGGIAVISTPYHGYWKNLALALTNKFDSHWSPLWDGGHIKFWSEKTLRTLIAESGLVQIEFQKVGRVPPLAKSILAITRK